MYENNEGGEFANLIVQDLQAPNTGSPEYQEMYKRFSRRILWIDDKVCPGAFQMNTAWYYAVPEKDPVFEPHSHEADEILGLFSGDPDNPYELNAEIIVTIGGEDHRITKSSLIFCPSGVEHGMAIKRVDSPVFHFSVVMSGIYGNEAYGE